MFCLIRRDATGEKADDASRQSQFASQLAVIDRKGRANRSLQSRRRMIREVALLSRLAHMLDDAGFSQIGDVAGNLTHNISEFRELILYYIFFLYVAELRTRLADRETVAD